MAEAKKSDLGVRTVSGIVMIAVAGFAIWSGGWVVRVFAIGVGFAALYEWVGLARKVAKSSLYLGLWAIFGALYIGIGIYGLIALGALDNFAPLIPILAVIGVDVGAYFAGRTFGGPKIAPAISPSKTWSGLIGGMAGASAMLVAVSAILKAYEPILGISYLTLAFCGCIIAIIAQTGDFFESWMKRRAGVKDSSKLIPGHGGVLDRIDGLLAVMAVATITNCISKSL